MAATSMEQQQGAVGGGEEVIVVLEVENGTNGHNVTLHEPTEEELRHSVMIFYIVLFVMIGAQSALVRWRRSHKRSYDLVTLIGLWLVPPIISVQLFFWRFLLVWGAYSAVTGYFLFKVVETKSIDAILPKNIYRWFLGAFKTSVAVGIVGYALLILQILSAGALFDPGLAIILVWYGLYFGVLTRDCAEVASDRMAARLGTGRKMAVSIRDCSLCGRELHDSMDYVAQTPSNSHKHTDSSVQLSCKHVFHSECIRGWLIVGKKDSCPACNEKVDLRKLYADKPWETSNLSWIQMLDMVRYLIVWQPTIMTALHFVFHVFHMDEMPDHEAVSVNATTTSQNISSS